MPQVATITSLPAAFRMMKAMQAEGVEWGEDYRTAARAAVVDVLATRMGLAIDRHLERIAERGQADRRNGSYRRWLLTELGQIELRCRAPGDSAPSRWCAPTPDVPTMSIA